GGTRRGRVPDTGRHRRTGWRAGSQPTTLARSISDTFGRAVSFALGISLAVPVSQRIARTESEPERIRTIADADGHRDAAPQCNGVGSAPSDPHRLCPAHPHSHRHRSAAPDPHDLARTLADADRVENR